MLGLAPFFHIMGLSCVLLHALSSGATVVTMPRFDLDEMLRKIEEHRISQILVPPPLLGALAAHPAVDRFDLSSLEIVDGEVWVRSPALMTGYLDDAAATAATIDEDGWLHTGDLGHFDDDGFLYLSDRIKDLIKVTGFQVAPAELEGLLRAHPSVADAAVVGRPDAEAGERPVAFVVARGAFDVDELRAFVDEQVAPYKRLHEIAVIEALPRSPTGKLLRRELQPA